VTATAASARVAEIWAAWQASIPGRSGASGGWLLAPAYVCCRTISGGYIDGWANGKSRESRRGRRRRRDR
jgi:hypothetical protein